MGSLHWLWKLAIRWKVAPKFWKTRKRLKEHNADLKKWSDEFQELCDFDWSHNISSQAISTLGERKYNKPLLVPLAKDIRNLVLHQEQQAEEVMSNSDSDPSESTWRKLAEVTPTQITMFNRRSVEVECLVVKDTTCKPAFSPMCFLMPLFKRCVIWTEERQCHINLVIPLTTAITEKKTKLGN